jgi:hypothetical protein
MQYDTMTSPSNCSLEQGSVGESVGNRYAVGSAKAFDRMARSDFATLSQFGTGAQWADYCPAYALGLVTYDACFRESGRITEQELCDKWEQLRGHSRLNWEQAQDIVARAWSALACLERDGMLERVAHEDPSTTEVAATSEAPLPENDPA